MVRTRATARRGRPNEGKCDMRKVLPILMGVVIVGLVAFTMSYRNKLETKSAEYATLQTESQETTNRYTSAINEITAIQDSLSSISVGDEGALALSTKLQAEKSLTQAQGDKAKERIAVIKAGVERAKTRIKDLEAKLQKSGVKIGGLEKLVQGLRKSVSEKEAQVAQLNQRVGELETKVTGLTTEVAQGKQVIGEQAVTIEQSRQNIESKRRDLATVYYTLGEKKQLKESGLVVSKGGLLGIGRTLMVTGAGDATLFTPLDTDAETVIRIPAKEARVLTSQPPASYEITPAGDQLELRILDASAFRAIKRVIILTS